MERVEAPIATKLMFLQYVEARQRRLTMRYATLLLLVLLNSVSSLTTIQVCQNKDCCKRFQGSTNLVHTLENLGLCRVETTGCLSHCDKGPNVCINDRTIHGIRTVEDAIDTAQSVAEVPTKLVAAVNVMERGQKAASFPEREMLYSSVIRALAADPDLEYSSARLQAQTLRAAARYEEGRWEEALEDTNLAISVLEKISKDDSGRERLSKAYRIEADVYEAMGRLEDAMRALQSWAACNPAFQKKVAKEVQRLQLMMNEGRAVEKRTV